MNEFKNILGIYRKIEKDETEFSNVFELTIFSENDQINFILVMKTQGNFGTVGKSWLGKGFFRSDHLALIIKKEKDWTHIIEDNETIENTIEKNESLPIEIYTDEKKVIVYHKNIERYISMKKVKL